MDIPLFSMDGVDYLFRWGHFLAGIAWIGLLYYFNFVQTEYFKEAEADHRSGAIQKLVPRALWWFRWGAALTFLTGLYLLSIKHGAWTYDIAVGATLGTLMAINVWFIIWPNQKRAIGIVPASDEEKAASARTAMLTSRINTALSIPMLYAMVSAQNLY